MLKYHLLASKQSKSILGTYNHYFSLGSHQSSPYHLWHIHSFSIITLNPKQHLPTISYNQEGIFETVVVPIKGSIKIDSNIYEESSYEKQILVYNPKDISTVENDEKSTTFAYIAVKGQSINKINIVLKRFSQEANLQIQKCLVLVLQGNIRYSQGDGEINIKSKMDFDQVPFLFYASKKIKLKISSNSLVLMVNDVV